MDRVHCTGEQLSTQTATSETFGQRREVMIRVLHDRDRDQLLVERLYEHATLVSAFDICNSDTVRSVRPLERVPSYVETAVYAVGYENIEGPNWP